MPPRCDPARAEEAARLQADAPGWLVMWRLWRRCFTAFECRDPDRVRIVEAKTADELRALMQNVEVERRQASSFPPTATVAPHATRP